MIWGLWGGGGSIFIYSSYARLISFEINFITKETSRAEPEYMNIFIIFFIIKVFIKILKTKCLSLHCFF